MSDIATKETDVTREQIEGAAEKLLEQVTGEEVAPEGSEDVDGQEVLAVEKPSDRNRTFAETLAMFEAGNFNDPSVYTQIDAGWYDWFCKDSALARKTKTLLQRAKKISKSPRFDNDKVYIFFKNNCPVVGSLYDDFRICDMETGNVLYTIVPRREYKVYNRIERRMDTDSVKAELWGRENDFQEPLVEGEWMDVVRYMNEPPQEEEEEEVTPE